MTPLKEVERRLRRRSWQENAGTIELYHIAKTLEDSIWTVRKTADALNRSIGSISEDLRLSLAIRIYPAVAEFKSRDQALEWLKATGRCQIYPCREWSRIQKEEIFDSLKGYLIDA
jgi:hypothetical protein